MKTIVDVCVFAVLPETGGVTAPGVAVAVAVAEAGGWNPHCKKCISAAVSVSVSVSACESELDDVLLVAAAAICRGRGRINCGWERAAAAMR